MSNKKYKNKYNKAPKLYDVVKIDIGLIEYCEYDVEFNDDYIIKEADNAFFRQLRRISPERNGTKDNYMRDIIFVNFKKRKSNREAIAKAAKEGFYFNGRHFKMSDKSASMQRNAVLGFIDSSIHEKMDEITTMGIEIGETVVSKYTAYRGLSFSSCFNLENYFPKIIVIDDLIKTIKDQKVKYLRDEEYQYEVYEYNQDVSEMSKYKIKKLKKKGILKKVPTGKMTNGIKKVVDTKIVDMDMDVFDGCGIHHSSISQNAQKLINSRVLPTTIQWRLPYIKGLTHEFNYTKFLEERGVKTITDIFGVEHSIYEEMIIITKSMYKGYNYFGGDLKGWEKYWLNFHKYHHSYGVSKWNYAFEEEKKKTRINYQVLQTLNLTFDDFSQLTNYSCSWAFDIARGDISSTYCFQGLMADRKNNPMSEYTQAMLKSNKMMRDPHIRKTIINSLKEYINDFKCGKLFVNGAFKFMAPDLVMLCEHAGGLEPVGALAEGELFAVNEDGVCIGEYAVERNPHISESENVLMNAVTNSVLEEYCSIPNVFMINNYGIETARLNGADFDGDMALLTNEEMIVEGSRNSALPIVNLEDKATAIKTEYNIESIIDSILLGFDNRIGELSNIATCYNNKNAKTKENEEKYKSYIDLISVANGVEIDSAKTGKKMLIPYEVDKFARPYPYFMRYTKDYYKRLELNRSQSNMNRLAWLITDWERNLYKAIRKFDKEEGNVFDYKIMMKDGFKLNDNMIKEVEELYFQFNKKMQDLQKQNVKIKKQNAKYNSRHDYTVINWKAYHDEYKEVIRAAIPDEQELASYVVYVSYVLHPKKSKKFAWVLGEKGILANIGDDELLLPKKDKDGEYEYLGNRYSLVNMKEEKIDD